MTEREKQYADLLTKQGRKAKIIKEEAL